MRCENDQGFRLTNKIRACVVSQVDKMSFLKACLIIFTSVTWLEEELLIKGISLRYDTSSPKSLKDSLFSHARTNPKKTVFIMTIILELILLNIHMTLESGFTTEWRFIKEQYWFFSAMCSIVCSVGYSQNTLEGKETTSPPSLCLLIWGSTIILSCCSFLLKCKHSQSAVVHSRHYRARRCLSESWQSDCVPKCTDM